MVTDKPPRRRKSSKEPLTIDATASKAEVVAEPVRSNDTDDVSDTAADAQRQEAPAERDAGGTAPDTLSLDDGPRKVEETPAAEDVAAAIEGSSPSESDPLVSPSPSPDETSAAGPQARMTHERRNGPATSTLVAAGIFGGIVALALAGSMQYAGYLPSGGTDTSTAGEIAALRQEVEALQQAPAPAPDQDLQARIQALEDTAAAGGDDGLSERLSAMEQEVQALRSAVEAASQESNSRLDRFRQQLEALEARVNEPGPEQAAARAITAAALKAAADEGRAFESELEAFAATAPDDPAVAQLQPYVQEGVPTPAQLSDRFSEASPNILEAVNQPAADQSIAQRLMSSALSVVKVRRTGETDGTAPEAIVSRIEGALRSSDLKGAASAWEALPEQAKAVSGDFKQALDARLAVDGLIADTVSRAVSETTNQNQGPTE